MKKHILQDAFTNFKKAYPEHSSLKIRVKNEANRHVLEFKNKIVTLFPSGKFEVNFFID